MAKVSCLLKERRTVAKFDRAPASDNKRNCALSRSWVRKKMSFQPLAAIVIGDRADRPLLPLQLALL
jgi:hypothetical protein